MIGMPHGTKGWLPALMAVLLAASCASAAEPPAGKEVADVIVQGNRIRTTKEILSRMLTKPGRRFSEITAQEDVGGLLAAGWFPPNGVQLGVEEKDGRLIVVVNVAELPSTIKDIIYRGAEHLSPTELEKLTGLKKGNSMSPAFNQGARQALLRKYQEMGRYWVTINLIEGNKLEDSRVLFDIAEGPCAKVSSIDIKFFGPHESEISAARLKTQVSSKRAYLGTILGGDFNPMQLELDIIKLAEYYHNLGYLDVRVQRELVWSENFRSVQVILHVEEGKRYTVAKVQIDGGRTYSEQKLLSYTDLREKDNYDKFTITADLKRIRDYMGYQGRSVTIRETVHQVGDGLVNVNYQLEEREPVRTGEIKIIGNTITRDNVIRRQLGLYPGQILSFPDMIAAEQALSKLGIFEEDQQQGIKPTVEIEHPEVDEPFKNLLVSVKEKPTGSFMIGAGVTSDAGLTGNIVVNERNFDLFRLPHSWDDVWEGRAFRGGGQEFRIEAVPGTQFQRYTVSLREPYLFDSRYSLATSGYFFQRSYAEYNEERLGARFTLGRRLDNIWTANVTSRIESINITNTQPYEPPEITDYAGHHFAVGTRLGFTRDERDNYLRPTKGSILDFGAEEVVGSYTYPLVTAEGTKFFTIYQRKDGSGKHVVAARSQFSYAGADTPVYDRFYAGGFRSLRGFSFRGVGPYIDGFNVGGTFAWMNSLEYQIPVMANDNLYFVAFIDSGTVERSVEIKDYRVSAGVGVRIAVPQLLGPVPLAL